MIVQTNSMSNMCEPSLQVRQSIGLSPLYVKMIGGKDELSLLQMGEEELSWIERPQPRRQVGSQLVPNRREAVSNNAECSNPANFPTGVFEFKFTELSKLSSFQTYLTRNHPTTCSHISFAQPKSKPLLPPKVSRVYLVDFCQRVFNLQLLMVSLIAVLKSKEKWDGLCVLCVALCVLFMVQSNH